MGVPVVEVDQVGVLCEWMQDARLRVLPAFRNLREVQPGFPSTTPGNGDPGGGSGGHGPSIVERQFDENGNRRPDDAEVDLDRARELLARMKSDVRDFRDIMLRWGYTTAGEHHVGARYQPTVHDGKAAAERSGCTHHAKFGIHEDLGSKGRGGLCGWCYTFQAEEGELPPASFIEIRDSRGQNKISTAMMKSWRESRARAAAAEVAADKKRAKRKRARR